jgi:BirA family biotin operon repressor/biotin-[acetyl-CoA-carboxylase] ligase
MNPKHTILTMLRSSRGTISGSQLSRALDVSRVSVWKHVHRLQQCGYHIEATAKGYRLLNDPDIPYPWEFPGREENMHHYRKIPSTMDPARKLARSGCPHFTVVVAEQQSAGRGRLSRSWHSSSGGLYFTIVLRPKIPPALSPRLNLCASLVLAETLCDDYNLPARVKWPNDVLVEGRKIAGILAEMEAEADQVAYVNIGVGVNVNNDPTPAMFDSTAMRQLKGRPVSRKKLLASFLDRLEVRLASGDMETVIGAWKTLSVTLGRLVKIVTLQGETAGRAVDVDANGSLVLELADGALKTIQYGDCFHM